MRRVVIPEASLDIDHVVDEGAEKKTPLVLQRKTRN